MCLLTHHKYYVTLQHAATFCNTLQHAATCCHTLQHAATRCNMLQHAPTCCTMPHHLAKHQDCRHDDGKDHVSFDILLHTTSHCNTLHQAATHFTKLQHAATHCSMLQHGYICYILQYTKIVATTMERIMFVLTNHKYHFTLQHAATHCNTLQHAATRCNTLQHAATRCNTPRSSLRRWKRSCFF